MIRCLLLLTMNFLSGLVIAQPAPRFHWLLDESNGTMASSYIGGEPGLLQGGVQWAPTGGHHQGAARFDGVDDRIVLGSCDMPTGGGGFSVSLWVKPDFVTGMDRTVVAKTIGPNAADHIWTLTFVNATALRFNLRAGGTTTELQSPPGTLFSGVWYHLVASYDGAQMRIHVNGALVASTTKSGALGFHPQAPASLGAFANGTAPFSGWIDDVRIHDTGLSDMDIIDLLFASIATDIEAVHTPYRDGTGALRLPPGAWERVQVRDMAGRVIVDQRLDGDDRAVLTAIPDGLVLVTLEGRGLRHSAPLFWSGR